MEYIIGYIILIAIAGVFRGTSGMLWTAFLGPFGFIISILSGGGPSRKDLLEYQEYKKLNSQTCPHCKESIKREAKVCRYCNRDIEPLLID